MGIDCSCCCLGFQFHFKKDRDMISTNALAIGTSAAVVMLAVSDFGTRQYHRIFRDNLTPLVSTTRVLPDKITAAPGDVFSVNYDYFRRPGCVGTVEYRLEGVPKGWSHPVSIPIGNFNAGWEEGAGTRNSPCSHSARYVGRGIPVCIHHARRYLRVQRGLQGFHKTNYAPFKACLRDHRQGLTASAQSHH